MIMGKTFSFVSGALFGAAAGAIIGVGRNLQCLSKAWRLEIVEL